MNSVSFEDLKPVSKDQLKDLFNKIKIRTLVPVKYHTEHSVDDNVLSDFGGLDAKNTNEE